MNPEPETAIGNKFLRTTLVTVFIVVVILATFADALLWLGGWAACIGATDRTMKTSGGGTVEKFGNPSVGVATTVSELTCRYPDGTVKKVGNDTLFLYGLGSSAGIGFALGALIAGGSHARKRMRMG
jgi:hypothetical protein